MSMLDNALAWAARGFRVFPLRAGSKKPIFEKWEELASTDAGLIRQWWSDPFGIVIESHNVGVCTTGMVVVDIDAQKGGVESFLKLGGSFDTLMVRTPRGGYHAYYTGPDSRLSVERIAPGIDIRSHNGYVIAPGSVWSGDEGHPGGAYELELDEPVQPVIPGVAQFLKPPVERDRSIAETVELDRPDTIEMATLWLEREAPVAIEGAGGDQTTYQVCCQLRDYGLSEEMSWSLLLDHWNERCAPPWDGQELRQKIENAHQYATGAIGSKHPAVDFGGINIPEPELIVPVVAIEGLAFGNAKQQSAIPQRDWRANRMLIRHQVSALIAPGGTSKSSFTLTLAAHKALGVPFAGLGLKPGKTIVYNAEDDLNEQSRRLNAICVQYGFDFDLVASRVMLLSEEEFPLKLTESDPPTIKSDHVRKVIELASDPECDWIICDPLRNVISCDENDNIKMTYVMGCLKLLAKQADVAIMVVHHTKKPSGTVSYAGDANSAAGAASIVNSCRIALTLTTATERDCEAMDIPATERHAYVRLDDAKGNYMLLNGDPMWFKRSGVKLMSGDEVGVVVPVDLKVNTDFLKHQMATVLRDEMNIAGKGAVSLSEAVSMLQRVDPLYGNLSVASVKNRIERTLALPATVDNNVIGIRRELKGGSQSVLITIE